jgi:hypothetical protein
MMKKVYIGFILIIAIAYCCKRDECYSPCQNLETAYLNGSEGCLCDEQSDKDTCIEDGNGVNVALMCEEGVWVAVEDGPCMPVPEVKK